MSEEEIERLRNELSELEDESYKELRWICLPQMKRWTTRRRKPFTRRFAKSLPR